MVTFECKDLTAVRFELDQQKAENKKLHEELARLCRLVGKRDTFLKKKRNITSLVKDSRAGAKREEGERKRRRKTAEEEAERGRGKNGKNRFEEEAAGRKHQEYGGGGTQEMRSKKKKRKGKTKTKTFCD